MSDRADKVFGDILDQLDNDEISSAVAIVRALEYVALETYELNIALAALTDVPSKLDDIRRELINLRK